MKCAAMDMVRAFCLLAVFGLCIPAATAVSAGGVQTAVLNVTNVSVTDAAFPADYRLTPAPVFLGFSTNGPCYWGRGRFCGGGRFGGRSQHGRHRWNDTCNYGRPGIQALATN